MEQLGEGEGDECRYHPKRKIEFVSTNFKEERLLKCQTCLIRGKLPATTLLSIQDIIESEENTIFPNWPFENDELFARLETIPHSNKLLEEYEKKLTKYFKDIKTTINTSLDNAHKNMQIKAEEACGNSKRVLELYNTISAKTDLKKALEYTRQADKEDRLRSILQTTKQNLNLQPLKEELLKFENDRVSINEEQSNKLLKEVENLISKMNLFSFPQQNKKEDQPIKEQQLTKIIKENSKPKSNNSSSILSQSFEGSSLPKMTTSQLILELVSNPFNCCSPQLLEELKAILSSETSIQLDEYVISGIDNKQLTEIQSWASLNTEQIELVTKFANQMSKFNKEALNDSQIKGRRQNNTVKIKTLLLNPFNDCSEELVEFLHLQFDSMSEFFNSLELPQNNFPNFQSFQEHNQKKKILADLKELVSSMNSLKNHTPDSDLKTRKGQLINALECCKESFDDQFLLSFKSALNLYPNIFANLLFQKAFQVQDRGKPLNYINLSSSQRQNIQQLINTIQQGTIQINNSIVMQEFPNSKTVSQMIKVQDKNINNYIADLLDKYPIFDLEKAQAITCLQQIQLRTELRQSQNITGSIRSTFVQNSCIFSTAQNSQNTGASQFYIPLNPQINYIFTFRASSFLNPGNKVGGRIISLGLVKLDNVSNSNPINEGFCFVSSLERSNVKQLRGNKNYFVNFTQTLLNFEVRLNLDKNILFFQDWPKYENQYEIDITRKDRNRYTFAINFSGFPDDWILEMNAFSGDDTQIKFFS